MKNKQGLHDVLLMLERRGTGSVKSPVFLSKLLIVFMQLLLVPCCCNRLLTNPTNFSSGNGRKEYLIKYAFSGTVKNRELFFFFFFPPASFLLCLVALLEPLSSFSCYENAQQLLVAPCWYLQSHMGPSLEDFWNFILANLQTRTLT